MKDEEWLEKIRQLLSQLTQLTKEEFLTLLIAVKNQKAHKKHTP